MNIRPLHDRSPTHRAPEVPEVPGVAETPETPGGLFTLFILGEGHVLAVLEG